MTSDIAFNVSTYTWMKWGFATASCRGWMTCTRSFLVERNIAYNYAPQPSSIESCQLCNIPSQPSPRNKQLQIATPRSSTNYTSHFLPAWRPQGAISRESSRHQWYSNVLLPSSIGDDSKLLSWFCQDYHSAFERSPISMHAAPETQRGWRCICDVSLTTSRKLLPPVLTRTLDATPPKYSKEH